jgi:hypothetical protein
MKKLSLVFALAAACSAGPKSPVTDDFSDLADAKSDAFSKKLKLMGTLNLGDSDTVSYTKTPSYRGWQFTAANDGWVHIHVSSAQGDPTTWLLDDHYRIMALDDDASRNTTDSDIGFALAAGNYYVVFRDYNYESHKFTVTFDGGSLKLGGGGKPAPVPPPTPTCLVTTQTQLKSCSTQWYDWHVAAQDLQGPQLGLWQLPKGVRSEWNALYAEVEGYNFPTVRRFDVQENMVYAVTLGWEEQFWGWLLDANGKLLAGGTSGDSGPDLNWQSPLAAADNLDKCDCTGAAATQCDYCAP